MLSRIILIIVFISFDSVSSDTPNQSDDSTDSSSFKETVKLKSSRFSVNDFLCNEDNFRPQKDANKETHHIKITRNSWRETTIFSVTAAGRNPNAICAEISKEGKNNFKLNVPGYLVDNNLYKTDRIKVYFNEREGFTLKQNFNALTYAFGIEKSNAGKILYEDEYVELRNIPLSDIGKLIQATFTSNAIKDIEFFNADPK